MDYSEYKVLQALLFFSLPIIWGVWQLMVLKRASKGASRKDLPE